MIPIPINWRCGRCGHTVPMDNRDVHEARCGRNAPATSLPPPPPQHRAGAALPSGVFDPDDEAPSDNVFTPATAAAAAAAAPANQTPLQRATPPQQRQGSPWREVDVSAASIGRQQRARLQAARDREQQYQARQRSQASSSSSSSSSSANSARSAGAGATAAAAAGARTGAGVAGGGAGGATTWACTACTFLNDAGASRCEMCGTCVPPEHRPPDRNYRDTLIGGDGVTRMGGGGPSRRRRAAGAAGELEAAAEEARCRLAARAAGAGGAVTATGDRSGGGRVAGDEDLNEAGGGAMTGAAAGSAIGALGAGLLSAAQPGARPGRVLASMLQGAFMGGVAGAALGGGIGDDPGARGGGGGGGTNPEDPRGQMRRQPSFEYVPGPGGARVRRIVVGGGGRADPAVSDLESAMLARRLEAWTLHEAAAAAMQRQRAPRMEGARGILFRAPRRVHGGGGGDGSARPASARSIAALPGETLTADSLSHLTEDGRQCCICLEDFSARERATRLPCLHLYHTTCIEDWLHKSGTCPQCKHRVD